MTPTTLQALLQLGVVSPNPFSATSRYNGIPTATLTDAAGRQIIYLRRRFVPAPESFALLQEYTVLQGDRLDFLAAEYIGDPEMFWRICDANRAIDPDDCMTPLGRKLRITLPQGVPGLGR